MQIATLTSLAATLPAKPIDAVGSYFPVERGGIYPQLGGGFFAVATAQAQRSGYEPLFQGPQVSRPQTLAAGS